MPTNLNALIRYKQIDKELRNPYLKTTIKSLQEACSNQLAEHRGIYKLISERTIRDDIRVMRSSALGFNAPIVVVEGSYFYSSASFTIFNSKMDQQDLLKEVLKLLIEEKEHIKSSKLEEVMKSLSVLTGILLIDSNEHEEPSMIKFSLKKETTTRNDIVPRKIEEDMDTLFNLVSKLKESKMGLDLSWNTIFDLI